MLSQIIIALLSCLSMAHALTIPYFAYGSNVYPSTMTALRRIECIDSTAAILPGYKLRFNIPGMPAVEPSWACVSKDTNSETTSTTTVHGVLYALTPQDFARVSISEGVPIGYQWKIVDVFPYQGDGREAGQNTLASPEKQAVQAYTLVSNNPFLPNRDIPPSQAYRDLLIKGAKAYKMDQSHIEKLVATPVGFTFGEGYVAKNVLEAAEKRLEEERGR